MNILGQEAITADSLFRLSNKWRGDDRPGVYMDVVQDDLGFAPYIGSATAKTSGRKLGGLHSRLSHYTKLKDASAHVDLSASKEILVSAHCNALVNRSNEMNLLALARFILNADRKYALILETVFKIYLQTFDRSAGTSQNRPKSTWDLLTDIDKRFNAANVSLTLPWSTSNGLNRALSVNQPFYAGEGQGPKARMCHGCASTYDNRCEKDYANPALMIQIPREDPITLWSCDYNLEKKKCFYCPETGIDVAFRPFEEGTDEKLRNLQGYNMCVKCARLVRERKFAPRPQNWDDSQVWACEICGVTCAAKWHGVKEMNGRVALRCRQCYEHRIHHEEERNEVPGGIVWGTRRNPGKPWVPTYGDGNNVRGRQQTSRGKGSRTQDNA
ncbi:hypothetical protein MMC25_001605 [Agyrium rufum]|nr:hypothetical protein [Agyrium rufum]